MNNELDYENLVPELLERVPVFARERESDESFMSYHDDSPYIVFGDFGRFLVDVITNRTHQSEREKLLADSFKLLDEMATSSDNEVVNVVQTTVFESLCDHPDATKTAREHLSNKGVRSFNKTFAVFGYE